MCLQKLTRTMCKKLQTCKNLHVKTYKCKKLHVKTYKLALVSPPVTTCHHLNRKVVTAGRLKVVTAKGLWLLACRGVTTCHHLFLIIDIKSKYM